MTDTYDPIPLDFTEYPPEEMRERARSFYELMARRRSVRDFSDRPVPQALIADAICTAGTAPMNFLGDILDRPDHERPYILLPVGYPAPDATVPDIEKKPLDEIVQWNR
jgi:nitroreductase